MTTTTPSRPGLSAGFDKAQYNTNSNSSIGRPHHGEADPVVTSTNESLGSQERPDAPERGGDLPDDFSWKTDLVRQRKLPAFKDQMRPNARGNTLDDDDNIPLAFGVPVDSSIIPVGVGVPVADDDRRDDGNHNNDNNMLQQPPQQGDSSAGRQPKGPTATTGLSNINWTHLLVALLFLAVAGAFIIGFCTAGMCSNNDDNNDNNPPPTTTIDSRTTPMLSPTLAPTVDEQEALRIATITAFVNNITYAAFDIVYPIVTTDPPPSSSSLPEHKALAWIIESDPLRLVPDTDAFRLTQRYALLTLWFQVDQSEFPWKNDAGWTTAENECVWAGITCDDDDKPVAVTEINLKLNNLHGRIPPDIGLLESLRILSLDDNALSGPLPTSIGRLTRLATFWVDDNRLTGTIPTEIGRWGGNMGSFWLKSNSFSSTLPTEIGLWTTITEFYVEENALSGTIPTEIGQWKDIYRFTAHVNKFRGPLPSAIGLWSPGPYYFNVRGNLLTGTVPVSIGENWTIIEIARFENNRFTGGSIALCDNITRTLTADCFEVNCTCCSSCCPGLTTC
jgi:hypothetical protein